ncbi:MAG: dihydroorotate dehydrogenase electron transfer subunit [Clostridia bacterium]|nr:dihydroorotate dehydrogenase electron transfer subunit [Clostridia bacterium]
MKDGIYTIAENSLIAAGVYKLRLVGDVSEIRKPGQFINIRLPGFYLRRPLSVCDVDHGAGCVTVVYKVVGKGTQALSQLGTGETLQVLSGLGNGYDVSVAGDKPLLIGGGAGVPPLYFLAKTLKDMGKDVAVVLGFNTKDEVFLEKEFRALGCRVTVTTVDGSYGVKGFVTDALPAAYSCFYTCGPEPMLKAVWKTAQTGGQFSLEERMGCGFGACMGCSCRTKTGYKRICKEGPVFNKEEILWED